MKILILGFGNSIPELVTAASTIINDSENLELYGISLDNNISNCSKLPLKILYKLRTLPSDIISLGKYLAELINNIRVDLVLSDSFQYSKYLAAVIANELNIPILTNVIKIEKDYSNSKLIVECNTALVNLNIVYKVKVPSVLVIQKGIFEKHNTIEKECKITELAPNLRSSIKVRRYEKKTIEEITKDVIIGIGRGVSRNYFKLVKELAKLLNAHIVCSRPLAVKEEICKDWIGLSGMKIAPKIYIALGISGQHQHFIGIRNSKTIIAINKDENAPIFSNCDYGFVSNIEDLLPKIIDILKSLK